MKSQSPKKQESYARLEGLLKGRKATVGVVGLGYVGLPLSLLFLEQKLKVIGVDSSLEKIRLLRSGKSYIDDLKNADIAAANRTGRFAVGGYSALRRADAVIICVPTPLSKSKDPDLSFVLAAAESLGEVLRPGQLVVLESTTYPGTTEEVIRPILERKSGLRAGRDFFLGFSPERVDPANRRFRLSAIPKVVSGSDSLSSRLVAALYGTIFERVIPVSSTASAEMVKLLENSFRSINIAFINEIAMICDKLKINVWEVIEAAATKPFGFMPFYPGPGIGGHCISIDAMYLAWKVRLHGYEPRLIELAQSINEEMPSVVYDRVARILNKAGRPVRGTRILALGVAYKKNVSDIRESPSLTVMELLAEAGAELEYWDPFVPKVAVGGKVYRACSDLNRAVRQADLIVILTDHDAADYAKVAASGVSVLDTRNAIRGAAGKRTNIFKL